MTHQGMADEFCQFVYSLIQEIDKITFMNEEDPIYYRVCFQKLYYALYHKMLEHDKKLSDSESSNKHEQIQNKLNKSEHQIAQQYAKMKALRTWADYDLSNMPPETAQLTYYQNQVYKILARKKITI